MAQTLAIYQQVSTIETQFVASRAARDRESTELRASLVELNHAVSAVAETQAEQVRASTTMRADEGRRAAQLRREVGEVVDTVLALTDSVRTLAVEQAGLRDTVERVEATQAIVANWCLALATMMRKLTPPADEATTEPEPEPEPEPELDPEPDAGSASETENPQYCDSVQ